MDINQFVKKVATNKKVQEKAQEVIIDKGMDFTFKLIKEGPDKVIKYYRTATEDSRKEKKEIKEKYNRLSKLVIDPKTDFNAYINGIEEADNMIIYFQNLINSLNKTNPTFLANKQVLTSKLKRWDSLKSNLISNCALRMGKECKYIFEIKTESSFFLSHPEINNELLTCNTIEDINIYKFKIFKIYIDSLPFGVKYEDFFEYKPE